MGYTTRGDTQMIAAGISAISMLDSVYVQNKKTLPSYYADLRNKTFPIERGHTLNLDDRIRRKVILDLMCNFEVEFQNIENLFEINFLKYFASELTHLSDFQDKGLLELPAHKIKVTDKGQLIVRNIAMIFDRYLKNLPTSSLFSQTI
jgi:oxygen-independent coproporphyrinogen-3 oxidase